MTFLQSPLNPLAICLLWLLQSCVVYHKTPSTLEEASELPVRAKVTDKQGEKARYRYIVLKDGAYYGVKKESGEVVKIPLQVGELDKVQLKNKVASTWLTVGLVALPVAMVFAMALAAVTLLAVGG